MRGKKRPDIVRCLAVTHAAGASKLGVVAFSSIGDQEMGDYDDEPTIIFRNGQFPSTFD